MSPIIVMVIMIAVVMTVVMVAVVVVLTTIIPATSFSTTLVTPFSLSTLFLIIVLLSLPKQCYKLRVNTVI